MLEERGRERERVERERARKVCKGNARESRESVQRESEEPIPLQCNVTPLCGIREKGELKGGGC